MSGERRSLEVPADGAGLRIDVWLAGALALPRAKVKELWSESLRTWFPKGADDPDIALLRVTVDAAEYWDSPSSAMVHLYGYVKAVTTGKRPDPGENEKVDLR